MERIFIINQFVFLRQLEMLKSQNPDDSLSIKQNYIIFAKII